MTVAHVPAPFAANPKQLEAARHWHDPAARIVTVGGAIRSGKTQGVGRLIVETAVEQPAAYLVARSTYRELEDSTKKAMLHGDGALPPLIPPELVDQYRASDNVVRLRTGAEILFRSLEEGNVGKLLNLTLGGVFVDQVEELDDGDAGERIFDTLLGRLSDPRGPRKLLAVANPGGLTHWVYRGLVDDRTRDRSARYVHVTMRDNAANLPADYVAAMEATRETRPAWYRSFVLGEWGAFEGQAYEEFDSAIHVVQPFTIPAEWERFESLDHGSNNPTAWHVWAADHDGNLVVCDEYYSPGLVVKHAAEILRRRTRWGTSLCWADPSMNANYGLTRWRKFGEPATVMTEYEEHGVRGFMPGSRDRRARYLRLLELLHVTPGRIAPSWSRMRPELGGAPRLYLFSTCEQAIAQFKSAPVAAEGPDAGEVVDGKWESAHGHAHASLAYGAMSRPPPSPVPEVDSEPEDPEEWARWARRMWLREREDRAENPDRYFDRDRYVL